MGGVVRRVVKPSPPPPAPTPAPAPVTPTRAEVSQATSTRADGYGSRQTLAQGRSSTVLTGPKGVEDETVTLGRRSLLGR